MVDSGEDTETSSKESGEMNELEKVIQLILSEKREGKVVEMDEVKELMDKIKCVI